MAVQMKPVRNSLISHPHLLKCTISVTTRQPATQLVAVRQSGRAGRVPGACLKAISNRQRQDVFMAVLMKHTALYHPETTAVISCQYHSCQGPHSQGQQCARTARRPSGCADEACSKFSVSYVSLSSAAGSLAQPGSLNGCSP